ncbi:MAG: UDP-N-acetylmuramate dehydrogenase [Pseudomonadota bacterium]|nr:UDP-N-acetylmuramate dehydrogenase [Pseudomonadota bacterium]
MIDLRKLTYYQTGGGCDKFYAPTSQTELQSAVSDLATSNTPYFILGAGTNSLVSDRHWQGVVLSLHKMNVLEVRGDVIVCQAGVLNASVVSAALANDLAGVGWMHRLPGQIGATTRMNARCYGGEISQVVKSVTAVSAQGELRTYRHASMFRGYKDTVFMRNGDIITAVELQLQAGDKKNIQSLMRHAERDRIAKGHFLYPSCGCVFKNDHRLGLPSGLLLEKAGVHRLAQGRVFVNRKHANFIFNDGGSSADIVSLSLQMREAVYQQFGIWLQYEMEFLGKFSPDLQAELQRQEETDMGNSNYLALLAVRGRCK